MSIIARLYKIASSEQSSAVKIENLLKMFAETFALSCAIVRENYHSGSYTSHCYPASSVQENSNWIFEAEQFSDVLLSGCEQTQPGGKNKNLIAKRINMAGEPPRVLCVCLGSNRLGDDFSEEYFNTLGLIINQIMIIQHKETQILNQQNALSSMGELALIGWWEVDLTSERLFWSDTTKAIHEVPQNYQPDLQSAIQFYKEGEDRQKITQSVEAGMASGDSWNIEARIVTAKGKELWVNAVGKPFYENGKCIKLFGAIQDIDEKVRLRLAHHEKRQQAEELLTARNTFLAKVSHELRTPINGINGMLEVLRGEQDIGVIERRIKVAQQSAKALVALINEVLDYSKIQHNDLSIQLSTFKLSELFQHINEVFAPQIEAKGISFKCEFEANKYSWVLGDRLRINQIVSNLLSNAVKFTHEGEISVKAVLSNNNGALLLECEVADTGIGIELSQMQYLFEPFHQGAPIEHAFGGSGLGLAIAKEFCHQMQGDISVTSTAGKGSQFSFYVQLQEAEKPKEDKSGFTPPDLSQFKWRVLVVDDNDINREVLSAMLTKLGVSADYAENGAIALDKVKNAKCHYDLIFMDCIMPVMNGYDVTEAIRKLPQGKLSQIWALTANTTNESRERCYSVGMNGFIAKPLTMKTLIETLQSAAQVISF